MKKINLILILFALFSANLFSQNNAIDKLFKKYANDSDYTNVYISGKMFSSIANSKNKSELKDIASSLKGLNILTTDKNPMDFYGIAKSKLYDSNYEELMRVKEGGSNVLIFALGSNGTTAKELVLLVGENNNTVLISFTGDIDLDKISNLGKVINFKGAEKLEKLNDR